MAAVAGGGGELGPWPRRPWLGAGRRGERGGVARGEDARRALERRRGQFGLGDPSKYRGVTPCPSVKDRASRVPNDITPSTILGN